MRTTLRLIARLSLTNWRLKHTWLTQPHARSADPQRRNDWHAVRVCPFVRGSASQHGLGYLPPQRASKWSTIFTAGSMHSAIASVRAAGARMGLVLSARTSSLQAPHVPHAGLMR